jgi:plastocyanin
MTLRQRAARAALVFAIVLGVCVGCENTMTGPSATPTPSIPTPTPAAPRIVYVGKGEGGQRANAFVDSQSGTATSTISAGQAIEWVWVSGLHSTTSGTCPLGCVTDGLWDSGIGHDISFQRTFPTAGTFPYFCLVHGTMMQGTVIVQ